VTRSPSNPGDMDYSEAISMM